MLQRVQRSFALVTSAAALALLSVAPLAASAAPFLQLDIGGGTYDTTLADIVTSADQFTLYTYVNPSPSDGNVLGDTYYLSIALSPQTGPAHASLGSIVVNGTTYDATADFTYGVPPIEANGTAAHDAGDLPQHGVYETFFIEVPFSLDPTLVSGEYNTADDPGLGPIAGNDMYYRAFDIDVSGLVGVEVHFDLFTRGPGRCNGPPTNSCTDLDVVRFAPPSHDASTVPPPQVPEPTAALVFGAGVLLTTCTRRRRS
jgi:hypothetical protein